jgi:glycine/D-amino acid oxidase-like deaminating enzyme
MTSLWHADAPAIPTDPFPDGGRFDHVVVGAGLTGLTTALLLARRGRAVAVLEARTVGALATGNTTAKLSQLQGVRLQRVRSRNIRAVFHAYVESQRAAFDWMVGYLTDRGIAFERRPAVTWAETPDERATVRREYEAARAAGLPVRWEEDVALPVRGYGAVVLDDQVQFDPMEVLASLAADVRAAGGVIVEGARAERLELGSPVVAHTSLGWLTASDAVLATGTPQLDRGLYWAKVAAQRSYLVSFRVPETTPHDDTGMFLGAGGSAHSVRWHRGSLLVGGAGHGVGRQEPGFDPYGELEEWAQRLWPGAEPTHRWSAQDYAAFSGIPFVGYLPRTRKRAHLATGYEKWGMTGAVAAALLLDADLEGRREGWQRVLGMRPTLPQTIGVGIGAGAAVASWYARGYAAAARDAVRSVRDGEPHVLPTAIIARETGAQEVCLVCPHLGGIVRWNAAESTWDCPAHGSRFEAGGRVIEGPAKRGLSTRVLREADAVSSS